MLRRNVKSVESVLKPEESRWWERFVKEVVLEPGVKVRELWMVIAWAPTFVFVYWGELRGRGSGKVADTE